MRRPWQERYDDAILCLRETAQSLNAAEGRVKALEMVLNEIRLRLHAAGRRPEECYEMSMIDAALSTPTPAEILPCFECGEPAELDENDRCKKCHLAAVEAALLLAIPPGHVVVKVEDLNQVEWAMENAQDFFCPACGAGTAMDHTPTCWLAAALKEGE